MSEHKLKVFFKLLICVTLLLLQLSTLWATDDQVFIKTSMNQLGFYIQKIEPLKDGLYKLHISKFSAIGPLTVKGAFKPFFLNVRVQGGKLWLPKSEIQKKHFTVNKLKFPDFIILRDFADPGYSPDPATPITDPVLREMYKCLNSVKRFYRKALVIIHRIKIKAARTNRVLTECKPVTSSYLDTDRVVVAVPDLPLFPVPGEPMDSPYRSGSYDMSDCSVYKDNSEFGLGNAKKRFEYLN